MGIIFFSICLVICLVLGIFSPIGFYAAAILFAAAAASAILNLLDKTDISARVTVKSVNKDENFGAKIKISGGSNKTIFDLVCVNVLSGERFSQRVRCDLKNDATLTAYLSSDNCGRLVFSAESCRRYDIFGITHKKINIPIDGFINCVPDYEEITSAEVSDETSITSDENSEQFTLKANSGDLSGHREYEYGDSLKNVNPKLSLRFGKLYVKEFSSAQSGEICLYPDFSGKSGKDISQLAEEFCRLSQSLISRSVSHYIAVIQSGGGIFFEKIADEDSFLLAQSAVLNAKTDPGENEISRLYEIAAKKHIGKIIPFCGEDNI